MIQSMQARGGPHDIIHLRDIVRTTPVESMEKDNLDGEDQREVKQEHESRNSLDDSTVLTHLRNPVALLSHESQSDATVSYLVSDAFPSIVSAERVTRTPRIVIERRYHAHRCAIVG